MEFFIFLIFLSYNNCKIYSTLKNNKFNSYDFFMVEIGYKEILGTNCFIKLFQKNILNFKHMNSL